eukprot:30294-Pelagococcus_subviridis.AAC.82
MVTQSRLVLPAYFTATSRFLQMSTLPNSLSNAGRTSGTRPGSPGTRAGGSADGSRARTSLFQPSPCSSTR